jgi:hypothetical protein
MSGGGKTRRFLDVVIGEVGPSKSTAYGLAAEVLVVAEVSWGVVTSSRLRFVGGEVNPFSSNSTSLNTLPESTLSD